MNHYRVNEIKLALGASKKQLPMQIAKKLGISVKSIASWEIRRESIDARDKSDIRMVYTVDFRTDRQVHNKKAILIDDALETPEKPVPGEEKLTGRPVVIGCGPCGLFAALELAEYGYKPLLIERGQAMDGRIKDVEEFREKGLLKPESNVLFGEGGAGTFSDGKLTSGIKDGYVRQVLRTFQAAGAGKEIMYMHRPHIGTDRLRTVIVKIREKITELGGEVMFNTKLEDLVIEDGKLKAVKISTVNANETSETAGKAESSEAGGVAETSRTIETNALVLAIGHSARDTFSLINDAGLNMEQKPFSIGVRMEHPQAIIDEAQYGCEGAEEGLPPAEYKLSYHASNGRGVYSFCMCPGGEVIVCSTAEGELCVNGMSNRKRDSGTANSGILCDVRTEDFGADDVLAGVRFQQKYERLAYENGGGNFTAPKTTMYDFINNTDAAQAVVNSMPLWAAEAISEAVPHFARKIRGYDMPEAVITAVETRSSSPVRILRGDDGQSNISGIYPAGEGAGYAGGITSAACDGIHAAHHIIERFAAGTAEQ